MAGEKDPVPPHVGHLQVRIVIKAQHPAGNDVKTLVPPELLAFRQQQLHPEADAQERLVGGHGVQDGRDEAGPGEVADFWYLRDTVPPVRNAYWAESDQTVTLVMRASTPTFSSPFCTLRRLPMP